MTPRNRQRLQLILVFAVFAVPALVAVILGELGWQPGTKSFGEPILPQRSFVQVKVTLADGGQWPWRDSEPRMTLIALPGPNCAAHCTDMLRLVRNARITLGKNMDRLRLLYVGSRPTNGVSLTDWKLGTDDADAFAAFRPAKPDTVAVLIAESNGTALLHYPPGFDPNGLRKDLQKVIR